MPIDDEQDDINDGSAGGQIRWSPDNSVNPAANTPGAAPVSWENLFSGAAPAAGQQTAGQQSAGQQTAQPHASAAGEPAGDPFFSRGPGQQPAPKPAHMDDNPFTTPVDHPPQQTVPTAPTAPTAPNAPTARPAPASAPQQAPPAQNAGFNPAPQYNSSSDQNKALGANPGGNPAPSGPKQYYTAEDIEDEILREQGIQPPNRGRPGQPQPNFQNAPPAQQQQSMPPQQPNAHQQNPNQNPNQQQSMPPQPMNVSVSGPKTAPGAFGTQSTQSTQSAPGVQGAQGMPGMQGMQGMQNMQAQPPMHPGQAMNSGQGMPGGPGQMAPPNLADQLREDDEAPDLSSVPEIEAGRIWEQRSTKEILMGILKAKKAEYAVALLASTDGSVQGEMLIVKSVVIHGAKLVEPDLSGYEALKVMLAIPHGTYTLLDVTDYVDQAQQLEQGLNVRITPLANALPYLPDTVDELMGASNISRIRSKGPVDLEDQEPQVKPPRGQTSLRERLPSTKILILSGVTVLALIMMLVVLFTR